VQHSRRAAPAKKEVVKDTAVHPQMPLIINVSIAKQRVRVYDANGFFAEAPVSTGMPGHPTPMGVFSVIQKDRYHHSNIYSGAPMPFMQRITWGGVALHAGVLPGYPASHGCIRMPESFAIKMWGWTKMGARVIVTPGELSPEVFSHPLLPTTKVAPQPVVAQQVEADEPVAAKADKGAPELKPIEANLELRATVGHSDNLKPTADVPPSRDTTQASSDVPATAPQPATEAIGKEQTTNSLDAGKGEPGAVGKPAEVADAAKSDDTAANKTLEDPAKPAEAKPSEAKPPTANVETAKPDAAKPDTAKPAEHVKAENPSAAAAAVDAKKDQTRMVDTSKPTMKPRREGQLAVFISRKDSKLYVRQNFAPLFEVPVTIAPSDRPLGTHVFTATVDKNDSNTVHWTVVSVPMSARAAMRDGEEPRSLRHHRKGKAAATFAEEKAPPLPDSPTEALDRIGIPADVMARITDALATGDSIVVSDQGINQGETGEYTDFIVRTY
jgi:hypothetical protein